MRQRGFTLIELLLSVAILTLLSGLSLPVYESFVRRNDLDLTAQSVVSSVRRAGIYARAVDGDSTWGVRFLSTSVTLFRGATYATRDANFDEIIPLPASVSLSGTSEIVFNKLSGTPNTTASVTLSGSTNDTRTITINTKGMVNY